MALPDGAAEIFATVARFSVLDSNGYVAAGANTFTTATLVKLTLTPVLETGDTLVTKLGSGTIGPHFKHGDMVKYYTGQLELAELPPVLEAMLAGGTVLSTTAAALTSPTAPTATASTTGGTLKSTGSYTYKVTACNQYGETLPSPASTSAHPVAGTAGSIGLSWAAVAGAPYYRVYGRTNTTWRLLAQVTGTTYTDTGAAVPTTKPPSVNTTAGPGQYGIAAPNLGVVGAPYGVAVELWGKAVVNGVQATDLPWFRWLVPMLKNLVIGQRDFTNAVLANIFTGQAFANPNFGTGPFGDWQATSTQVWQKVRASAETFPTPGLAPVPATV